MARDRDLPPEVAQFEDETPFGERPMPRVVDEHDDPNPPTEEVPVGDVSASWEGVTDPDDARRRDGWEPYEQSRFFAKRLDELGVTRTVEGGLVGLEPDEEKWQQAMDHIGRFGDEARYGTDEFRRNAQRWYVALTTHTLVLHQALRGVMLAMDAGGTDIIVARAQASRLLEQGAPFDAVTYRDGVLPPPVPRRLQPIERAPEPCQAVRYLGALDLEPTNLCGLALGHEGPHVDGDTEWSNPPADNPDDIPDDL